MKTLLSLLLGFFTLSAHAYSPSDTDCQVGYEGCMKPGMPCHILAKDSGQLESAIQKAYLRSPSNAVILFCKGWRKWKSANEFPEFQEIFDHSAKHWYIYENKQTLGPFSRDQLKSLKEDAPVKGASALRFSPGTSVWSGVRMGKNSKTFVSASTLPELVFNVLEVEDSKNIEEDPFK